MMIEDPSSTPGTAPVSDVLRAQLAQGSLVLETLAPIMQHLLASGAGTLFSEAMVARTRGMIAHLAEQLLTEQQPGEQEQRSELAAALFGRLAGQPELLVHCHARALEWYIGQQLKERGVVDPVLSPMLQSLIASQDAAIAELAMNALASQARFELQVRQMHYPLDELPRDQLAIALECLSKVSGDTDLVEKLQPARDDHSVRADLFDRLVQKIGTDGDDTLKLDCSGLPVFISAIGRATGQSRDSIAQTCDSRQSVRLALSLRAAGLSASETVRQLLQLNPDTTPPADLVAIEPAEASATLRAFDDGQGQ